MTKNQKRKDRKLQQLPHMVASCMIHVATVFAAVMSAASVVSHKRLELFIFFLRERGNVQPG